MRRLKAERGKVGRAKRRTVRKTARCRTTLMVRDILKALRETILLSQRVETIGGQVAALARNSREEVAALRQDAVELRERITRVEAFLEAAKMFADRDRLPPPRP